MALAFQFEIPEGEQVRASRVLLHRQPIIRWMYVLFPLGAVAFFLIDVYALPHKDRAFPLTAVIVAAAAISGVTVLYRSPRVAVRAHRANNRAAAGPHTFLFADSGLEASSPGALATYEWANIAEVTETAEFLFFSISKGQAMVLPKRAIPAEQLAPLRELLRSKLSERAHLE
jgi:hypothetical protein